MRVRRVWFQLAAVAAAGFVAAAVALSACDSGPDRRFAADTARAADVVERVSAPGTVQAAAQADLHAPSAAKLADLRVRDGQQVMAGQVVAQLSSAQVDDSIRQARAAVDSAAALDSIVPSAPTSAALAAIQQVQQQVSTISAALLQALRSTLSMLPEPQRGRVEARLDQAERQVAEAQRRASGAAQLAVAAVDQQTAALRSSINAATAAQRGQAQLALDLAMEQKDQLTLRAPIAGTVQLGRAGGAVAGAGVGLPDLSSLPQSAQQAVQGLSGAGVGQSAGGPPLRVGDQVSAGQIVATVYDVSELQVATEVDETDIVLVKRGQSAEVELDAFPGMRFEAKVRRIAVAPSMAQSAAGGVTYQVDLQLGGSPGEDSAPAPRVGMTATAEIQVRRALDALSVPGSALIGRVGGQQAVLVIEGGRVHTRPVKVSVDGEDRVAISSGLRPGERVVSRGAERLHDGDSWPGD
ncbi:MAG TPA: HlyD family efflux transporter periplasmic adaptor subunit [Actinomycetes bacterium]|jgi:multidrug efflux pump subunit AcrA (membrane-fusion protein)|nr:HlyD family efflux transporter periplasmic adaptor subunit [Actinomycetes bacterium]